MSKPLLKKYLTQSWWKILRRILVEDVPDNLIWDFKRSKTIRIQKKIVKRILVEGKAKEEDCGAQNMVHERK